MAIVKVESRRVGLHIVDTETGEIYHREEPVKKKVTSFNKEVGVDVKYPNQCITTDSLLESLSVMDAYLDSRVNINVDFILEAIISGNLTSQEGKLVKYLAENITAWNYYIGSVKDICKNTDIKPKNIAAVISKLSPNILRVLHRNKPDRGDIVITINPKYAWKGDNQYRNSKLLHWYEDTKLYLIPKNSGIDSPQSHIG